MSGTTGGTSGTTSRRHPAIEQLDALVGELAPANR